MIIVIIELYSVSNVYTAGNGTTGGLYGGLETSSLPHHSHTFPLIELFCNGHFILEFGQFISVTWLNLLRRLGFSQTLPPVGTVAHFFFFFFFFFFFYEPSLSLINICYESCNPIGLNDQAY